MVPIKTSGEPLLVLVLFFISVVLLLRALPVVWKSYQLYKGVPSREPVDISPLRLTPPPELHPIVTSLRALGFERFGEVNISLPGRVKPDTTWMFVHPEKRIYTEAVFVSAPPLVLFFTVFEDHATVETGHPKGEHINDPNFRTHVIPESVEVAYQHHLEQVADFGQGRGEPVRFENIADYFEWEAYYRTHYAQRTLGTLVLRQVAIPVGALLYLSVGLLALYVLMINTYVPLGTMAAALFVLVLPTLLAIRWSQRKIDSTKRSN